MANTYTQISIHGVFAVARRENLIISPWREDLHKYISGILSKETGYALAAGGWKDHVHIFFELTPIQQISEVMKVVKSKSSGWINDNRLVKGHFNWQSGYGAFSHSRSQRPEVIQYIMNQENHHRIKTFKEEYFDMLKTHGIQYENRYLFEFFD